MAKNCGSCQKKTFLYKGKKYSKEQIEAMRAKKPKTAPPAPPKPKKKIIKKVVKKVEEPKPKKKIVKKVVKKVEEKPKKEAPKHRRRKGRTREEIEKEARNDNLEDMSAANGVLEIGKLDPFKQESNESENRLAYGFYVYRNIKTNYKDDKILNKLADEFKKLVMKKKNTPLMKEALNLNKISTSGGTRLKDTKKDVNKIFNSMVESPQPKKKIVKKVVKKVGESDFIKIISPMVKEYYKKIAKAEADDDVIQENKIIDDYRDSFSNLLHKKKLVQEYKKNLSNPAYQQQTPDITNLRPAIRDEILGKVKPKNDRGEAKPPAKKPVKKVVKKEKPIKSDKSELDMDLKYLKIAKRGSQGYDIKYYHKNLEIELIVFFKRKTKIPEYIYMGLFNSQIIPFKPRAPKGYASRVLCQLLHHLLKEKIITPKIPFELMATNLKGDAGNQNKLVEFYHKKLGFKIYEQNRISAEMKQSVKSFLKKCEEDGQLIEELSLHTPEITPEKPTVKAKSKPPPKPTVKAKSKPPPKNRPRYFWER